jgi:hypothetical protein
MKNKIKEHLTKNPGYFKWGKVKLADKYGCSLKTINEVMTDLTKQRKRYLAGF